jgi:uncharacterized membrane protein
MHLHHPHHEIKPRKNSQKHSKRFWYWVIGVCVASLIALIAFSQVTQSRIEDRKMAHDQRYQVSGVEVLTEQVDLVLARIKRVISEKPEFVAGTTVTQNLRTIEVELLEGSDTGKKVLIENDHLKSQVDEKIYVQVTTYADGVKRYTSAEAYRMNWILVYLGIFIALTIMFGGMQGVRGLLSLFASVFVIFYLFLPQLVAGFSPLIVSVYVSGIIIVLGSYVTHGFNRTTSAAVIGMISAVCITGFMSLHAISVMRFTGVSSDEIVTLVFNSGGELDLYGLLLGGIIIGLLGILYDVAIGQAIIVEELLRSAPHLSIPKIFERAIRIGREHIGALVNNLALAYVGASLPLLLLFYSAASGSVWAIINREDIATEIVRTLIGSIGLVLAVPLTTLITIWMLKGRVQYHASDERDESVASSESVHRHHHSHNHNHH